MYVLGVDTSTDFLSVALCDDARTLAEATFDAGRTHAEKIMDTVDEVLARAGVPMRDIGLLAVTRGPGSFTGIRIAAATMKGLAVGLNKPLIGVSTLSAMARLAPESARHALPLLDARIHEVYGAIFRREGDRWIAETPESVGPIEKIAALAPADCMLFGEGAQHYAERLHAAAPHLRVLPTEAGRLSAVAVAQEALAAFRAGDPGDPGAVRPVYLRQSQPEEARRRAAETATA
jgi:tRNA threonylcarbamoyladenosine biosynthesis protein TsaB